MIKPKPLNKKMITQCISYPQEDFRKAVEWLKEEDNKVEDNFKNKTYNVDTAMVEEIFRRFKENRRRAFPDLNTKKGE